MNYGDCWIFETLFWHMRCNAMQCNETAVEVFDTSLGCSCEEDRVNLGIILSRKIFCIQWWWWMDLNVFDSLQHLSIRTENLKSLFTIKFSIFFLSFCYCSLMYCTWYFHSNEAKLRKLHSLIIIPFCLIYGLIVCPKKKIMFFCLWSQWMFRLTVNKKKHSSYLRRR